MIKYILLSSLIISNSFSLSLESHPEIKIIKEEQNITLEDINSSENLKNPILSFGVINLQDDLKRNKELMQSQFIKITQELETSNKLKLKKNIHFSKFNILKNKELELKLKKSSLFEELNVEYILNKEKLNIINSYILNLKKIILFSNDSYKFNTIKKSQIFIYKLKLKKYLMLKEKILTKQNKLLIKGKSISDKPFILKKLKEKKALNIDIDTHPIFMIFKEKIIENQFKINLNKENKIPNFKVSLGYYQRETKEDFLNFSFSIPLPIYGNENSKIIKSKHLYNKSVLNFENLKLNFKEEKDIIINDVNLSYYNLREFQNMIKIQEQINKQIEIEYENENESSNILKIYLSVNNLFDLHLSYIEEKIKYHILLSKLKYYKGEF